MKHANPACVADPSHQHHDHDIEVSFSGKTYDAISGGGLWQTERPWIADEMLYRRVGFGGQYVGVLSLDDATALYWHVQGYGELFTGGGFDPGDTQVEGRACLRDAARMKGAILRAYPDANLVQRA